MKQKNKIKFIPAEYYDVYAYIVLNEHGGVKVSNPTKYKDENCPDGTYYIRGDSKNVRLIYYKLNGVWYLIRNTCDELKVDLINSDMRIFRTKYTDKEWQLFNKLDIKLFNKQFQKELFCYNTFINHRNIKRRVIKRYSLIKNKNL